MNTMGSHRLRLILIIAFAAVVLGVGTTAVLVPPGRAPYAGRSSRPGHPRARPRR